MVKLIIFAVGLMAFFNQFDNTLGITYVHIQNAVKKLTFQDNFKMNTFALNTVCKK